MLNTRGSGRLAALAAAAAAVLYMTAGARAGDTAPTVGQIIERMQAADEARSAALASYTATRRYVIVNRRLDKRARVTARVSYLRPGRKSFELLGQDGSRLLADRVLKRVIKAEEAGSQDDSRRLSRIHETNYRIRLMGTESIRDRHCYVLELIPVSKSPYLVKGRAWIDTGDYAVVRIEGVLAKKPSIWVGSPLITQDYSKQGMFWLPSASLSTTDAALFGRTDLRIEYGDYELHTGPAHMDHAALSGRP